MELENFIGQTLTDIANGINIANSNTRKNEQTPFWLDCSTGAILFDIAVTASDEGQASAKGGVKGSIKVVSLDIEGDIDTKKKHERISRIQFRITPNDERFHR